MSISLLSCFTPETERPNSSFPFEIRKIDSLKSVVQFVFANAVQAINAYEKGALSSFDALVGNETCELVALQVALLAKNLLLLRPFKQAAEETLKRLKTQALPPFQQSICFEKAIKERHLDLTISKEAGFLFQCFLLRLSRQNKPREHLPDAFITNVGQTKKLCNGIDISIAEEIIYEVKGKVARQLLQLFPTPSAPLKIEFNARRNHVTLPKPDFFEMAKMFIEKIEANNIPILVKNLTCTGAIRSPRKTLLGERSVNPLSPLIVLEVTLEEDLDAETLKTCLTNFTFKRLVLADAAQIGQERGSLSSEIAEEALSFLPTCSAVRIDHFFCSTFGEQRL